MRDPAKTFEDVVWRKAHQSVRAVYRVSRTFPRPETFGVSSQSRRAAVSTVATIAEGFKKRGRGDTLRFLNIAQGSLEESRSYPILAQDLDWGDGSELKTMAVEVSTLPEAYSQAIQNPDSSCESTSRPRTRTRTRLVDHDGDTE